MKYCMTEYLQYYILAHTFVYPNDRPNNAFFVYLHIHIFLYKILLKLRCNFLTLQRANRMSSKFNSTLYREEDGLCEVCMKSVDSLLCYDFEVLCEKKTLLKSPQCRSVCYIGFTRKRLNELSPNSVKTCGRCVLHIKIIK